MRDRRARVVLSTATLLLLASVIVTPPGSIAASTHVIPWGLSNCEAVIAIVPTTRDAIAPHLPPGFKPTVPEDIRALLPPDPRVEAVFGMEALTCESGRGLHGSADNVDYGSYWSFVEAPQQLHDPRYPLEFVKWDTLIQDPATRRELARRGFDARNGTVTPSYLGTSNIGLGFHSEMAVGKEVHRLVGAAASPVDFTGSFIEFMPGAKGLGEWRTDYSAEASWGGGGVVQLEPASFPAEVLSTTQAQAYFLVAVGLNFTKGSFRS